MSETNVEHSSNNFKDKSKNTLKKYINNIFPYLLLVVAVFISTIAIVSTIIYTYNFHNSSFSNLTSDWGAFGSFVVGTTGTMIMAISLILLYQTYKSQKEELEATREILKSNLDTQNEQKFENTFYSLLELHNQTLKELSNNEEAKKIIQVIQSDDENNHPVYYSEYLYYLQNLQDEIIQNKDLSQYFRVLYQLLKFIAKYNVRNNKKSFDDVYLKEGKPNEDKEKMYASIVRSFIPSDLLPILALNCICREPIQLHNLKNYWYLLERYNFLEHINLNPKIKITFLIFNNYSQAFGDDIKNNKRIKDKIKETAKYFDERKGEFTKDMCLYNYNQGIYDLTETVK